MKPVASLLMFLLSMIGAALLALLMIVITLRPPLDEIAIIAAAMFGSGLATLVASYVLYIQQIVRFPRLLWTLLGNIIVIVLLIFMNVWINAQLMFINQHDLILTTALLVFAGITAISFGFFVTTTITDRVHLMRMAANDIAQGKLDTRLEVRGRDEIAELTRSINRMAANLEQMDAEKRQLEQKRRDLIAWASHDLRTPLTSIQAMIEALSDDVVNDPQKKSQYLRNTLNEIHNLSHLVDNLFELAQMDAGHVNLNRCEASLSQMIDDTVESMMVAAANKGIQLQRDLGPDIDPVYVDPVKIQRVLYNLIDNAIGHMTHPGEITVKARRSRGRVEVLVHNTGTIIPPEHLSRVFERFYRVEPSRTQEGGGQRRSGLGLAITRGFIEAHGGEIDVVSNPEKGTTFRFWLPASMGV